MFKKILITRSILLSCVLIISQYSQGKAAENSTVKGSPNLMEWAYYLSEDEIKQLKDEGLKMHMARVYNLSEDEIRTLQEEALKGTPEPAYRLFLFYELYKRDSIEGNFWAVVAAENGNPVGQYNLALRLNADPDPRNRKRARFWLERAANNKDKGIAEKAVKELNRLKEEGSGENRN